MHFHQDKLNTDRYKLHYRFRVPHKYDADYVYSEELFHHQNHKLCLPYEQQTGQQTERIHRDKLALVIVNVIVYVPGWV